MVKKIKHNKKAIFHIISTTTKLIKVFKNKSVIFFVRRKKNLWEKKIMKYIGQCLVNFLDHSNVSKFHSSNLEHYITPKSSVLFLIRKVIKK